MKHGNEDLKKYCLEAALKYCEAIGGAAGVDVGHAEIVVQIARVFESYVAEGRRSSPPAEDETP